jgi:hypothetical protein
MLSDVAEELQNSISGYLLTLTMFNDVSEEPVASSIGIFTAFNDGGSRFE